MDLKNAAAVCLISLFSATLVVLIARALDDRAASRLEPQLAAIVEELQAIRRGGGIAASQAAATDEAPSDGLMVYYFHSNARCPTCQSIESQAHDAVTANFGPEFDRREMAWMVLNYEQPAATQFVKKFDIQMPVVVLAKMESGHIKDWKRLDEVWALERDKPAFAKFVQDEITRMLGGDKDGEAVAAKDVAPEKASIAPTDLPVPTPTTDIPVP